MSTTQVLLIDGELQLRSELAQLIELDTRFVLVGEVATIAEAESMATLLEPQIIVAATDHPGVDGDTGVARLLAVYPTARVLARSHLDTARDIRAALRDGAFGYMVKLNVQQNFLPALRTIARGQRHLCPIAAAQLRANGLAVRSNAQVATAADITRREREVLTLIATGLCNKQMAAKLSLSVKTIEKHRANLMRKLEIRKVADLTRYALRQGLLLLPPGGSNEVAIAPAGSGAAASRWLRPAAAATTEPIAGCGAVSCSCPHRYFVDRRMTGRRGSVVHDYAVQSFRQERRTPVIGRRAIDQPLPLAS